MAYNKKSDAEKVTRIREQTLSTGRHTVCISDKTGIVMVKPIDRDGYFGQGVINLYADQWRDLANSMGEIMRYCEANMDKAHTTESRKVDKGIQRDVSKSAAAVAEIQLKADQARRREELVSKLLDQGKSPEEIEKLLVLYGFEKVA